MNALGQEFESPEERRVVLALLLAFAVLALNDLLLKHAHPSWLTGKLSDLAGCFLFPFWVAGILGLTTRQDREWRMGVGVLTTLALFVPIKCSPLCAQFVSRALDLIGNPVGFPHHRILADPTDLIGVPFTFLAFALVRALPPSRVTPFMLARR